MDAPDEELVTRIAGRRTCESCQSSYTSRQAAKVAGVCDRCGGTLIQRSDDSEAIDPQPPREYDAKTQPVLDYFTAEQLARALHRRRSATWTRSSAASTPPCC